MELEDVYGFIVYNCGIEPKYFLDEMSTNEVGYISTSYIKSYKEKWEMLRFSNHAIISSQATKKVDIKDVLKFDWDNDDVDVMSETDAIKARNRIKEKYKL